MPRYTGEAGNGAIRKLVETLDRDRVSSGVKSCRKRRDAKQFAADYLLSPVAD